MKRIALTAASAIALTLGAAEEINFNKNFAPDAKGAPAGWSINPLEEYKPLGSVELIKGDMDQNSIRMVSKGKQLHYYCMDKFSVKGGDTITVKARISGKGKIAFGGYFYGAKSAFVYGFYPFFEVPAEPTVISKTFTVEARDNMPAVEKGMILLAVSAGADVTISELDAEVEPAKK